MFNGLKGATAALLGIAVLAFASRMYIQIRILKRFPAEDWLLVFAVIVLIGCSTLYFVALQNLYDSTTVIFDGFSSTVLFKALQEIPAEAKEANAMSTFWWFIIFPVKLAYLIFFRKLIKRLKHLSRYWWFAVGFLFPALIINEVVAWQTCPYDTIEDLIGKCSGRIPSERMVKVGITTTVFDVLSDIFIASIPICLLWRVRIATRQKVGLGLTLCLSLVMAIFALVRIAGMRLHNGDVDIVWLAFWQQNECSIAVTMVSLISFRSFFIASSDTARDHRVVDLLAKLKTTMEKFFCSEARGEDPGDYPMGPDFSASDRSGRPMMIRSQDAAIPGPTITGMRTAIDNAGVTRVLSRIESGDDPPGSEFATRIVVAY